MEIKEQDFIVKEMVLVDRQCPQCKAEISMVIKAEMVSDNPDALAVARFIARWNGYELVKKKEGK